MKLIRRWTLTLAALLSLPLGVHGQFSFLTNNGALTVVGYSGPGGAVVIPATAYGLPVTSIGEEAFWYSGTLSNVTIPDGITNIGAAAFMWCTNLMSAQIPSSVINIDEAAFLGCESLADLTIPVGVVSIGQAAFVSCYSLTNLIIPDSVTTIGRGAFAICYNISSITLGEGLTSIASDAFQNIGVTNITVPSSVTNLGLVIFQRCTNLNTITVDPPNPFFASENGVLLDKSKTTLMEYPGGRLGPLAIPRSVTTIDAGAFEYMNLTNITIPASVTNIGRAAFYSCNNLVGVFFAGNAPTIDSTAFFYDNAILYYLPGTLGWTGLGSFYPVLWNPQIQTTDSSLGAGANGFGFNVTGTANIPIVIEASTSLRLADWIALQMCTLTNGSIYFSDPQWTNHPSQLYRIRSP